MDSIISKVIHQFFESAGGSESAHVLVRHQIESYNEFLDKKLQQVIHGFNPIVMCHNYDTNLHEFTQKLSVSVTNPRISKPLFTTQDGAQIIMTPHMARMNNLSYAANLYVDVHATTEHINQDGVKERTETQMPNICIGKMPIMVRSKACTLQILSGISENLQKQECKFDHGGYFIINGNEKVIITQDRISENRTLVFPPSGSINESGLTAEVRSMYDGVFLPPKTTSINLSARPNHLGRTLRVSTNFLRSEIPLFILFRALGIESDKDIITHIVLNPENPKNARLVAELAASAEDASDIGTMEDAQNHLLKIMGVTGTPREYMDNTTHAMRVLKNVLTQDLLPHVGTSFRRKALYLGYMVRKILKIYLGYETYDNRDSYIHKRADPPGVLLGNLFRQCYSKLIKEMRNMVQRELHQWRANPQGSIQIINETNVHRFFKSTVIDTGMRYALSTGNWGVKSVGSFTNIRQGVAQVLNRLSYLSTLSHLRRLNTPMEKSGKLVQPRKLDNSQFGMVCPAETPEGSSVGLVKNMALSTQITVACSSSFVRQALKDLGTRHYDDTTPNPQAFLNEMGSGKAVHLMVNGDLIGYHTEPLQLYTTLKSYKRKGMIAPTTSIAWDIQQMIIMISTEGGRLCRPLYVVDDYKKLRIQGYYDMKGEAFLDAPFSTFVVPIDKEFEEGCIEFLDMEEINNAMIAMFPKDLKRGVKGVSLPPQFTHCEIHPALMSGVLAANIPFMNHNQSPRNCYQASMGKQAVGVYATNYLSRMDTLGHVLNYGQKPMVRTSLSKYTHSDEMPFGVNAVVAIMTYSGFNQEDSVMINESALDRGLFTSTYYKAYRDVCNRNHSTGEEEHFVRPTADAASKPFRYDKLGPDGFVPKNTYVDGNDIIVGKVMPHKAQGVMTYRDTSMHIKNNEDGIVDENYIGTNSDGYKFCKVRLRCNRRPQIGDKAACLTCEPGNDHRILTDKGLKTYYELTDEDKVAVLKDGVLVYEKPIAKHYYPEYKGQMYRISNQAIDLNVTHNHRMWVSKDQQVFDFEFAENLLGQKVRYQKTAIWDSNSMVLNTWMNVFQSWESAYLPNTVWSLSPSQCQTVIFNLMKPGVDCKYEYTTPYQKLAEDIQRLALHAGWYGDITQMNNLYQIKIYDSYPIIQDQQEELYDYEGPVFCLTVSSGVFMIERNGKMVWTGNSRMAQKGTLGMTYKQADMPFTKDGIVPDIIMNPHAIPSRMTMGQLMECLMGKASAMLGSIGDSTPFTDCSVEQLAEILQSHGMERYGNEILYNGRTGEQIHTEIFIGPTYYQRLKHMTVDKMHSRSSNGPVVMLTRQPAEGRARNGGLRFGEMERDAMLGHGAAAFLKERMMDVSDNYRIFVCKTCGMMCPANPEKNIYKCNMCKSSADVKEVRIPYAAKLLFQELLAMSVAPRMQL